LNYKIYIFYYGDIRGKVRKKEGRPRRRWVDNIKMDVGKIGLGNIDWIDLALE
jgi:hypothetical protein